MEENVKAVTASHKMNTTLDVPFLMFYRTHIMHICIDYNRRTINFQTPITMMMVMMTGIYVFDTKDLAEIPTSRPQRGREMQTG